MTTLLPYDMKTAAKWLGIKPPTCECGRIIEDDEKYCRICLDTYDDRLKTEMADEKRREISER